MSLFFKKPHLAALALMLSSCCYIEQIQETRRRNAGYEAYLAEARQESPALKQLREAAARATSARVQVMPGLSDLKRTLPMSQEELDAIKEIFQRLKDMPPLSREAWESRETGTYQPLIIDWQTYCSLELLDAQGKILCDLGLTVPFAQEEEMGKLQHKFRLYSPRYMLPVADWERFYALPAIKAGR